MLYHLKRYSRIRLEILGDKKGVQKRARNTGKEG
jgi:hypothetical protein